jgi:glucose-1-phosphate adenylyltransferase
VQISQACDFGKHVIPFCHENNCPMYAYEFHGYWKDVGTLDSYWQANMELIDLVPEFNLYEEYWKIYTKSPKLLPQYVSKNSVEKRVLLEKVHQSLERCIILSLVVG